MTKPTIHILVIEDSPTDVLLLEAALNRDAINSFALTIADRLDTGLEKLHEGGFDLVLLDLGLPDSQGLATFEKLHKEFPTIPVVLLSGLMDDKLALEAVQAGAQDYLVKGSTGWEIAPRAIRYAIERQQSQFALRETNERLQALIQASPVGIVVLDSEGIVRLWSPSNEHIFGWSESEALGKTLPYIPADKHEEHKQLRQRVLQGEAFTGVGVRRHRKDGSPVDISVSTAPLRDVQGNIIGILGLSTDITERKFAEEKLNQSETRYRLATKATNDVIWEWNAKTHQLMWTENAQAVFGYSPEENGSNENWWDEHIHPDDRDLVLTKLNDLIAGNESIWSEEYRFQRIDGSYLHISDHAYVERDGNGELLRMIGAMSNVTERKQAEEALRDSERRYRSLFEDSPISLWEEDFSEVKKRLNGLLQKGIPDFRAYFKDHPQFVAELASLVKIVDVNKATVELYQAKEKEELIKNLPTIFNDESYDEFAEELMHILEGEAQFGWEGTNQTVKGKRLDISLTWSVVPGHEDDLSRVILSITDITERKQAEEALRESEERFRTLINQVSHIAIQGYGPDGAVRFWNEASEEIYGFTAEETLGKNLLDLIIPPEMHTEVGQAIKNMVENGEGIPSAEISLMHKDGSRVPVYSNHTMIETRGYGKELFCIDIDLTERKRAEEATQRRNAELTVLNQIGQALSKLAEPSEIFEAIFTGIGQVLDNHNLYIALYDQPNQQISFPVYTMNGEHRTGADRPFSNGITEYVIRTNTPLLIKRDLAETLNQCGINMIGAQSRSFLAVPVRAGDKVIGVIALQDYNRENVYDEHHVELLTTIAAQTSVALENARLFNEVQQELVERKRAEEALRQSNELLSLFIKQSPIYAYIKEVTPTESRVLTASENFQDMIGVPGSLMAGKTMVELFPPEFAAKITADDWAVVSGDQVLKLDEELDDRSYITIKFPIAQGEKNLLAGYTIEITEQKRAEAALQESEERFRSLYNNATIGLYRTTPDGRILMCNPAAVRLLGFESFDELAKRNLEEAGFEPTYPRREFREKMERDGQVIGLESIWIKKDGNSIFVRESATTVRDSQGKILYYDGTFEDITSHKQAEKALRESEMKFKTLFEIAPVGISVLDRQQNIIDTNYALQRITGSRKHELVNGTFRKRTYLRPDGTVMPPDEFASTRALKENLPIFDVETGIVTKDRGVVWTQVSAAPLDIPDASLVVITQDISERKLSEQTLRHRLAELETLYESGLSLSQLLEPKEIGQKIIDVLAEKLDWYHTTIRLYRPESDSLELLAYNIAGETNDHEWQAMGDRFRSLIARLGDGLSGWALQHGETVRCADVLQDPRYLETVPGVRSGLYVPIKTGERAIGVISVESEKPDYFTAEDEHLAVTLAAQAAVALENIRLIKDLQKSNQDLFLAYDKTIEGWSNALDLRDKETEGHTQRVTALTEDLARAMGIQDSDIVHLRRGALLHDIGKMGVPDRILLKPDKLTDDEWVTMRQHPVHAYNLLSRIEFLGPAFHIPHYHHERWDGSGYPDGLKGEQIPLEARIFAVVDVYDALTSDRPYRPAWPRDKAIRYIEKQSGIQFDPQIVEAFLKLVGT